MREFLWFEIPWLVFVLGVVGLCVRYVFRSMDREQERERARDQS